MNTSTRESLLFALLVLPAAAAGAAVFITDPGSGYITYDPREPATSGYVFTVNSSDVQVSALGVWDFDADGLFQEHLIGL
jgi:hypothetical protein